METIANHRTEDHRSRRLLWVHTNGRVVMAPVCSRVCPDCAREAARMFGCRVRDLDVTLLA